MGVSPHGRIAPRSISADRLVKGACSRNCARCSIGGLSMFGRDGESFLDAAQNARVVWAAEHYYRLMYRSSKESWNLRDRHMFDTLVQLLAARGSDAKAVVWAHNSHVGNAAATGMGWQGEFNIGESCRAAFGDSAVLIGFGADRGTVAAASEIALCFVRTQARTRHWGGLSARNRIPEPLFRGSSPRPVRCLCLVRANQCGDPACRRPAARRAGYVSLRPMTICSCFVTGARADELERFQIPRNQKAPLD
jgi:Erythromycin esterase